MSFHLPTATAFLLCAYGAVALYLAWRGARQTRSMADYAVGSKGFPPIAVGLSLAASMTSAATFIINPGFTAMYGLSAVLSFALVLPAAAIISLIVFTKGFQRHGQAVKALTMAQWIGQRYQHKGYALFFAFTSLLLLTFIVLICVGITKVLAAALNVGELPVLIGVVVFVFGYMMFGGANSMVYTNAIQAGVMLLVACILLGSGAEFFEHGVGGFWGKLAGIDPQLTQTTYPESPFFRDYFEIIVCQIVIGVAIVCQPHIITKSLLLRSDKDINRYLWTGVTVETIFFFVVITGLFARLTFPDLTLNGSPMSFDSIMSNYVVQRFANFLGLVVILGLIFAGISTLEGLIQSLSTTITSDILEPLLGKGSILTNRLVIVGLAVASLGLSWQQLVSPNQTVAVFAQNGVYAYFSAAFVPVLLGTFTRLQHARPAFIASAVALLVHFGCYYGGIPGYYLGGTVRNPGIAATIAILSATAVGLILFQIDKSNIPDKSLAKQ